MESGLPSDQPTLRLFSVKTSSHNRQTGLQGLAQAGRGQGHCHLHLPQTISC